MAAPIIEPGGTYTVLYYLWGAHQERGEADDSKTVTCPQVGEPDLTELFPNQGECISEANNNPDAGFTKDDCKDAFKDKVNPESATTNDAELETQAQEEEVDEEKEDDDDNKNDDDNKQ